MSDWWTVAAFLLGLSLATCQATPVGAQLDVARCAVGEAGWDMGEEAHLVVQILRSRAVRYGMTADGMARAYCQPLREPEHRPWVSALPGPGQRWPEGLLPRRYQVRWAQALRQVRAWFQEPPEPPPCGATHWAGRDWQASERLEPVACGDTRNIFYRKRSR